MPQYKDRTALKSTCFVFYLERLIKKKGYLVKAIKCSFSSKKAASVKILFSVTHFNFIDILLSPINQMFLYHINEHYKTYKKKLKKKKMAPTAPSGTITSYDLCPALNYIIKYG